MAISKSLYSVTDKIRIPVIRFLIKILGRLSVANEYYTNGRILNICRRYHLKQECSIFGKYRNSLTDQQYRLVDVIYQANITFLSGSCAKKQDIFTTNYDMKNSSIGKISVVMPKYIDCNVGNIQSDITSHIIRSAKETLLDVDIFFSDDISYSNHSSKGMKIFKEYLLKESLDCIVIDGNYIPKHKKSINSEFLNQIRIEHKVKVVTVIADCYDVSLNTLGYWVESSDLVVVFSNCKKHMDKLNDYEKSKVFFAPFLPFCENSFVGNLEKDIDMGYIGSRTRNRELFMDFALSNGMDVYLRFHDRSTKLGLSIDEYIQLIKRTKITFNNGWVGAGEDIMTGRTAESILANTLLMYEHNNSLMYDYFIPFIHFIPVSNVHQFMCYSQFFLENEDLMTSMTKSTKEFYINHYSSKKFWTKLIEKLSIDKC
jgi:hypothetical protein